MIYFQKVNNNNMIRSVSQVSIEIFKDHYIPILGQEQVDYMIGLFHTPSAIKRQMREGGNYYLVFDNSFPCGYFCTEKHGQRIFLSKLYLHKDHRGQGTGTRMLKKILEQSEKEVAIYLMVNKHNDSSLGFYIHEGFKKIGEITTDIGCGYVMDDYIMEKRISREMLEPLPEKVEKSEQVKEEKKNSLLHPGKLINRRRKQSTEPKE